MVICLEQGANDLHMVHPILLPTYHLLLKFHNGDNLSGAGLPRLFWKRGH